MALAKEGFLVALDVLVDDRNLGYALGAQDDLTTPIDREPLTAEDRQRLNGSVERVVRKGSDTCDALLREVRDLVAAAIARRSRR